MPCIGELKLPILYLIAHFVLKFKCILNEEVNVYLKHIQIIQVN